MVSELFLRVVVWGSVLVVATSTVLAWRQRPKPGATAFTATIFAATWWITASSIGLFTTDRGASVFWAKMEWVGMVAMPVAWLAFALAYTGRSERLSRRLLALLSVVPVASLVLVFTNGTYHELVYGAPQFHSGGSILVVEHSIGPWFWVHVAYSYALLSVGTALILGVVAERRMLYRGQAFALLLVVVAPWIGSAVYLAGLSPVPFFDPTPYTFVISGAAGIAAFTQLEFLDALPVTNRVARRSVVENVDAGVVVADADGHIVDANPRAADLLAGDDTSLVGDSIGQWFPSDVTSSDEDVVADGRGNRTRYLDVGVTELIDGYDNVTGRIFLVRDVTDRRSRVQRLNVLNRVLRHNLRNEMNVIYGQADRLSRGEADPERVAEEIRTKAAELTGLANKAREIDQILGESEGDTTDLCRVVSIERDRVTENSPAVAVDVTTPEGPILVDAVVGTVVRNVVENAVEHNTAADPHVSIEVRADEARHEGSPGDATTDEANDGRSGEEVRVVVTDNGPGIPEGELAALEADLETQLDHASGLGLWLAQWGATAAGGAIDVSDREPTGTRVTVELPRAEPSSTNE